METRQFSEISQGALEKLQALCERAAILTLPSKRTTADVWAFENRVYPPSMDRPGPRDPTLTPYVIDFERAFDDPRYSTVALVCGSLNGQLNARKS